MERPALIVIAIIAGGVLLLWNSPSLDNLAPAGWQSLSPLTALGIMLAVGSIALSTPSSSPTALRFADVSALLVFALGTAILGAELASTAGAGGPNVMLPSPQTAAGLSLVGMRLVLMRMRSAPLYAADFAGILLLALVMFMTAGHLFDAAFVEAPDGRLISIQTLLCLVLLGFVVGNRLALRGGLFSFLADPGQGGRIARLILPFVIATPFVSFALVGLLDDAGALPSTITRARLLFPWSSPPPSPSSGGWGTAFTIWSGVSASSQ